MSSFLLVASYSGSVLGFRGALIEALLSRGFDVHVAAPSLCRHNPVGAALLSMGVKIHDFPLSRTGLNPFKDIRSFIFLYRLIREIRPNHMLFYTIKPIIYGLLAASVAAEGRRNALVTGLGYAFQHEGESRHSALRWIVHKLYGVALTKAHKVFFQNPDDQALFHTKGILPFHVPSRVVNGSGVSVDQFSVAPLPSTLQFLLIARLLGDKGVREYFMAAKRVKQSYPDVMFKLVGWVDENPDAITHQELDAWVSSGVIEYLGKLEDVRPAITDCSVYVLPSYREGTPRTVLEAMAMGRAVITTDAPGCKETVIDGDNGFLVPVKSVDALVIAMEKFVSDPGLAVHMGRRSREIAVDKYDVNKVNEMMLKEMDIS